MTKTATGEAVRFVAAIATAGLDQAALACRPEATSCVVILPTVQYDEHGYGTIPAGGCMNIHVPVTFNDGVVWLARVRNPPWAGFPLGLQRLVTASDLATMRALEHSLLVPPRDLAALFIDIGNHPYEGVGSLHPDGVGPLLLTHTNVFASAHPLGPFATVQEAYLAQIDHCLPLIGKGLMHGPSTHSDAGPVPAYCMYLEMRSLVAGCTEMVTPGPTFIKHGDEDTGNHLLVAPDGSITAVLDWEFASVTSFHEAFTAHQCFAPASFRAGCNALSEEEIELADELTHRGREDMAAAVRGGRKYHRLRDLIGWGDHRGDHGEVAIEDIWGLRGAFLEEWDRDDTLQAWLDKAMVTYAEDEGLQGLLAEEKR